MMILWAINNSITFLTVISSPLWKSGRGWGGNGFPPLLPPPLTSPHESSWNKDFWWARFVCVWWLFYCVKIYMNSIILTIFKSTIQWH